jgi:hypothetical protein
MNEGYFDPWSLLQALRTKVSYVIWWCIVLYLQLKEGASTASSSHASYVIAGAIDGCCLCGRHYWRS